jgi:hypothetical protein
MSNPAFQRRHYEMVAATLKGLNVRMSAIVAFADMFAADNPRFDRARFLKACGVDAS